MNGTFIYKFLAVLKKKRILGNVCFSEQIFYRKQSLGAPDTTRNSFSSRGGRGGTAMYGLYGYVPL